MDLILLFLTVTVGLQASASDLVCARLLAARTFGPEIRECALADRAKSLIREHEISQLSSYFRCSELYFYLPHDRRSSNGESIQAAFISRILREIFDAAEIFDRAQHREPVGKCRVKISVHDKGEFQASPSDASDIPMRLLKPANAITTGKSRNILKQNLKLTERFVISLYLRSFWDGDDIQASPGLVSIISQIEKVRKPDLIFLSGGGMGIEILPSELRQQLGQYKVVLLSDFLVNFSSLKAPMVVLNDIFGWMPYIHGLSDIAVITGPINIFEAINAGTKTIFFNNIPILRSYDPSVFNEMASIARASGRAVQINSIDEMHGAVEKCLDNADTGISAYETRSKDGFLIFHRLLDLLLQVVRSQL